MNIILPYTKDKLRGLVPTILQEVYKLRNLHLVELCSPDGYWKLLSGIWERGDSVVIVEHDVLPWPGAIEELVACPMPWCSYTYHRFVSPTRMGVGDYQGFGCCKFEKRLMKDNPAVFSDMKDHHWSQLDTQFEYAMWTRNLRPHHHRPAVIHLPANTN